MQIIKSPNSIVKKITLFVIAFLAIVNVTIGQVSVKISDGSANKGQTVDLDVTYSNFTDIVLFQYSINWDATKFSFNSIVNVTTVLDQFSAAASIGSPANGGVDGRITVSWSKTNTQPESLPNNTRLFTIRLNAIGNECAEATVRLSNTPTAIEFVDSNTSNVGAVATNGLAKINGTNCNGGGGLTISAAKVSGPGGTNICVPITVTNFNDIQSLTVGLKFNPSIARYTSVKNSVLPGFTAESNVNAVKAPQGELTIFWFDNTGVTPLNLTGTIFEVCYDIIGVDTQVSPVELVGLDFSNSMDQSVPATPSNGSITVVGGTGETTDFTLVSQNSIIPLNAKGCVPISVKNFDDIQSMQFAIMWDANILTYSGTEKYNLVELSESNFNPTANNKLRVTWNNLTGGTSIPDDRVIFEVCFTGKGDCDGTSNIMFTNDPPISIEVSNGSNEVVPVGFVVGKATVECGCNIGIKSLVNPTCNGSLNGSIQVALGSGNYNCKWTNASGTVIQESANCDIANLGAGTYTLTIDDGAGCQKSREFVLTQPAAIVFGGSKVNEDQGCDGRITVQMIGGTPPFVFNWNDGSTGNIKSNLCAGEYCLTVTDKNNCIKETCFTIQPAGINVTADNVTNVTCFGGNNGAIDITIAGGTSPYTYAWSGPSGTFTTQDLTQLTAGVYNYTITDSSVPSLELKGSYTVTQPAEIKITGTTVPSDGTNGAIDISVTGGVGPYNYVWSPTGKTTQDISGLAPGEYTVLVTDDKNCNILSQIFKVNSTFITINITSPSTVKCFGNCDASINGSITGGSGVFTYTLNGSTVNFPISNLCPGDYVLKVEDDQAVSATKNITIAEPNELTIAVTDIAECSDNDDGFLEVGVSGGTGSYSYVWNVPGSTKRISNLPDGKYSVLVTDGSGCTVALESQEIKSCDPPVPCFTSRTVISPNGDEYNNEFYIACADDYDNNLSIYNRWGAKVFNMVNYDNSWTGLDQKGEELPEGGYMWVLEITNSDGSKELKKGTVTILRDQF